MLPAPSTSLSSPSQPERWGARSMPDFSGYKIFVAPGAFYSNCVALFAEAGFQKAAKPEDADVIAFIGGVDVDPSIYGDNRLPCTDRPHDDRENFEQAIYHQARVDGKPMVGICRGAQFLHAMNGGKLWQHVTKHGGPDHLIHDIEEDVILETTSLHHQMLKINDSLKVVAVASTPVSNVFIADGETISFLKASDNTVIQEIEAGAYETTKCFFTQGHPEIGSQEYRSWFMQRLEDHFFEWGVR